MELALLREMHLVSDSKKKAEYHLFLFELPHHFGYVITKKSGPAGKKQPFESWYRETFELAIKKFEAILSVKTSRKKGRQYKPRQEKASDTLPLFS